MYSINNKHTHSYKSALFLLSFMLIASLAVAQQEKKLIKEADAYFKSEQYDEAAKIYRSVLAKNDQNAYAYYQSGHCTRLLFNYALAEIHYNRTYELAPDKYPLSLFYLALMQKLNGRYTFAISTFESFRQLAASEEVKISNKEHYLLQAEVEQKGAELAITLRDQPFRDFNFTNVAQPLNSQYNDYAPTLTPGDSILVISSGRPSEKNNTINPRLGEAFGDNHRFVKKDEEWEVYNAQDGFEKLNSKLGDGAGTFSTDGKKFYFTSCNEIDDHCYIYLSEYLNQEWQTPQRLDESINKRGFDSKQPALTASGDTLFFVSNRSEGQGQNDIWMSIRTSDHKWAEATNLGDVLNTPFNEVSPFYYAKENVLFFSSDGHHGFGGLDVYRVSLADESSIVNLGRPFNSNYDDAYFMLSDGVGFMASNRMEGSGRFDIYTFQPESEEAVIATIIEHKPFAARNLYEQDEDYRFYTPEKTFYSNLPVSEQKMLEDLITASVNELPLNDEQKTFLDQLPSDIKESVEQVIKGEYKTELASISPDADNPFHTVSVSGKLWLTGKNSPASSILVSLVDKNGEVAKVTTTNEDGSFKYTELAYNQTYKLLVSGENNKLTQGLVFKVTDLLIEGNVEAPLTKYFENIYFNFDSYDLRPEAKFVLDDLLAFCKEFPTVQVEVNAFTDQLGKNKYNEVLSKKRADAVFEYLIAGGMDRSALVTRARGEEGEVSHLEDPYLMQQSRRCEFILKGEVPSSYRAEFATYLIKPKTTLYSLGRISGMKVDDIKKINGLSSNHIEAYRPIRLRKLKDNNPLVVTLD